MRLQQISADSYDWVRSFYGVIEEDSHGPWWPSEWAENVIANPKFREWLTSLGVSGDVGAQVAGGVGRAFFVGDSFVVKFTADRKEASAAAIIKGSNSNHAARVYDVKRVMTIDDPRQPSKKVNLFAIVMERLNTDVGKRVRAAGNAVYSYLDDNSGFIEDPESVVSVVMAKYLDEKNRRDPAMAKIVERVVNAIYDVQQKSGVLMQDPHGGNMAFKGRNPAFFDFGRSSTNYDHPSTGGVKIVGL